MSTSTFDLFYLLSIFPVALSIVMLIVYIDETNMLSMERKKSRVYVGNGGRYNPQKQEYIWDVNTFFR